MEAVHTAIRWLKKIEVYRGYKLKVRLTITMQQFLEGMGCSTPIDERMQIAASI